MSRDEIRDETPSQAPSIQNAPQIAPRTTQTPAIGITDPPRDCRCGHPAGWHVWNNTACGDCGCNAYREAMDG